MSISSHTISLRNHVGNFGANESLSSPPLLSFAATADNRRRRHHRRSGTDQEERDGDVLHLRRIDSSSHRLRCSKPRLLLIGNPRKWEIGSAASSSSSSSAAAPADVDLKSLEAALTKKDSDAVKKALTQLNESGWANKWSSQPYVSQWTTSLRELTSLGIKNAENLAIPSVIDDAAFLFTVVGTTGFLGVLAGQLPGDWGFFLPYLLGSISLVVLAIGSTSPGAFSAVSALGVMIFLLVVAYLLGVPILGYSLDIGKEHVNLIDEKLEKLIYSGQLDTKELDRLAVVAMAGLAAEGLTYHKVVDQSADLFTLKRFINRSKPQLSKDQQQNLTRWAVLFAGSLLKNKAIHEALITAMQKATVLKCIQTIETG
ncbi:hypothetical protein AKJ16_DCAP00449 [Drosera capensis]